MGKLTALLFFAGVGGWGYWHFLYQSPAYLTYIQFEEGLSNGDCALLYALVDEQAKEVVDKFCTDSGGMTVMGQTVRGRSAASMVAEMKDTPQGEMLRTKHDRQSEETGADGSVSLVVIETPLRRTVMTMGAEERHEVKLKKLGEAWKIVAYKAEAQK
jgi:hypothetical protein